MTEPQRARFMHAGTVPPIGWIYEIEHEGETFRFQSLMQIGHAAAQAVVRRQEAGVAGRSRRCVRGSSTSSASGCPGSVSAAPTSRDPRICPCGMIRTPPVSSSGGCSTARTSSSSRRRPSGARPSAKLPVEPPRHLHQLSRQRILRPVRVVRAGRETSVDAALDTCRVCKCLLRAKVWVQQSTLNELSRHTYPENCWLHGTPAHIPPETEK